MYVRMNGAPRLPTSMTKVALSANGMSCQTSRPILILGIEFRPLNLNLSGDGDLRMTEYNLSIEDWGGSNSDVPFVCCRSACVFFGGLNFQNLLGQMWLMFTEMYCWRRGCDRTVSLRL